MTSAAVTQWRRPLRRTLVQENKNEPSAKYLTAFIITPVNILYIIACLVFITSCKSDDQQEKKENVVADDSLQTVHSIVLEDSVMIFENKADSWIGQSIKQNDLNWERFHLIGFWSEDSLTQQAYEPKATFYRNFAPLLRWSPDSNYILDIGSYGAVLSKDKTGKSKIESGEADTEIALLYPKSKMRSRLLFFGPSTTIIDGQWLDSSQVAVLGMYDERGDNNPDTLLWIFNAKDKFFRKYQWE